MQLTHSLAWHHALQQNFEQRNRQILSLSLCSAEHFSIIWIGKVYLSRGSKFIKWIIQSPQPWNFPSAAYHRALNICTTIEGIPTKSRVQMAHVYSFLVKYWTPTRMSERKNNTAKIYLRVLLNYKCSL